MDGHAGCPSGLLVKARIIDPRDLESINPHQPVSSSNGSPHAELETEVGSAQREEGKLSSASIGPVHPDSTQAASAMTRRAAATCWASPSRTHRVT